jgi:hypothetical protein
VAVRDENQRKDPQVYPAPAVLPDRAVKDASLLG